MAEAAPTFPLLHGYRALAATAVLVTHVSFTADANRMPLGDYLARLDGGVAVFFLLSGFLLYRPFVAARLAGEPGPAIGPYLWRRFLRIYPAYWLALTVVLFIADTHDQPYGWKGVVLWYGLVHTYDTSYVLGPLLQSWTLAAEVAFYLFLPLWAARLRHTRPHDVYRHELAACAALVAVGYLWRLGIIAFVDDVDLGGTLNTWLPAQADLFALGMGLAVVHAHRRAAGLPDPALTGRRWFAGGCFALAFVALWVVSTRLGIPPDRIDFTAWQQMGRQLCYGAMAFFLLLPGVFGPPAAGLIRRALGSRIAVAAGVISYGIYLWHQLWIEQFLRWFDEQIFLTPFWPLLAFTILATLASATACWFLLERPLLRRKDRPPRILRNDRSPVLEQAS